MQNISVLQLTAAAF